MSVEESIEKLVDRIVNEKVTVAVNKAVCTILQTAQTPQYLTIKEISEKYRISKVTIHARINDGTFHRSKVGGRTLISVSSIETALSRPRRRA